VLQHWSMLLLRRRLTSAAVAAAVGPVRQGRYDIVVVVDWFLDAASVTAVQALLPAAPVVVQELAELPLIWAAGTAQASGMGGLSWVHCVGRSCGKRAWRLAFPTGPITSVAGNAIVNYATTFNTG